MSLELFQLCAAASAGLLARLVRGKRTGDLALPDAGKESLADFGEERGGHPTPACSTVYAAQWPPGGEFCALTPIKDVGLVIRRA